MKLRQLEGKDAEFMLEWMHDDFVVKNLKTNFTNKTLMDCKKFIADSHDDSKNLHMAIVNEADEYLGTVSLKHIDDIHYAEFAITVRKKAMGHGFSKFALNEILRIGFENYGLNCIYWCVDKMNLRAIKFYDKNRYPRVPHEDIKTALIYTDEQINSYIWYAVTKAVYKNE